MHSAAMLGALTRRGLVDDTDAVDGDKSEDEESRTDSWGIQVSGWFK